MTTRPTFKIHKEVGGVLDPEVIPLLNDLNAAGLKTWSSHLKRRRGWVIFERNLTQPELEQAVGIAEAHGLEAYSGPGQTVLKEDDVVYRPAYTHLGLPKWTYQTEIWLRPMRR